MNLAIWGTKREGIYLKEQLEKLSFINIAYFIDNNEKMTDTDVCGIKCISFSMFTEKHCREVDTVILAVRNGMSCSKIIEQLGIANVHVKIGLLRLDAVDFSKNISMDSDYNSNYIIWLDELRKPLFPYLQAVIIDKCNFSCKGCTHFANLFSEDGSYNVETFEDDIKEITKNSYILRFRILGGEPLLHPELDKLLEIARRHMPETDIRIVTNGVLLPRQEDKLFLSMEENDIGLDISAYKPVLGMEERLKNILNVHKVNYCMTGLLNKEIITEFVKNIDLEGKNNPWESMEKCHSNQCRTLRQGRIYKCPYDAYLFKLMEYFQQESMEDDGYDIYHANLDWEKMIEDLNCKPVDKCRYCSTTMETFGWELKNNPDIGDWVL